jgi:hypothetical protein
VISYFTFRSDRTIAIRDFTFCFAHANSSQSTSGQVFRSDKNSSIQTDILVPPVGQVFGIYFQSSISVKALVFLPTHFSARDTGLFWPSHIAAHLLAQADTLERPTKELQSSPHVSGVLRTFMRVPSGP